MAPSRTVRTRAQFRNQLLARRASDPLTCITQLIGVYSTAPTSHLALIARLDNYRPADLDELLLKDRSIVRMGAMRGSGYLVPTKLVPTIVRATEERRTRILREIVGKIMDHKTYERLATKIENLLSGTELTTAQIRKALKDPRFDEHIRYVIQALTTECRLVTTRTSGTWRSNLTYNAVWSEWLPKVDPWSMRPSPAKKRLAQLYFDSHGPATIEDFAWWSGLKKGAADVVAEAKIPEVGDGYFGTLEETTPAQGVRLLPIWDPVFLTHKDRTHAVPAARHRDVYDTSGNPTSVVMVDGLAAGQWDLTVDKTHHHVKVAPFERFSAASWKRIQAEVQRVGAALDAPDMQIERVRKAAPIADGEWNRFMSPLKGR